MNVWLLRNVFDEVVTVTKAEVAPAGTVAVINVDETILNFADSDPNFTLVTPDRFVPRMPIVAPALAEFGSA